MILRRVQLLRLNTGTCLLRVLYSDAEGGAGEGGGCQGGQEETHLQRPSVAQPVPVFLPNTRMAYQTHAIVEVNDPMCRRVQRPGVVYGVFGPILCRSSLKVLGAERYLKRSGH